MDLADDERIRQLNQQIQKEQDPEKLIELIRQLIELIDEKSGSTPPE